MATPPDFLPFAFLPVNKPVGPTSHDVVGRVRRLLPRKTKVGHTGTLDPFASGLMILGVGKATRFADDIHLLPKSYRGIIRLGVETDTLDHTGRVTRTQPVPQFDDLRLQQVTQSFVGIIQQIPPVYSARKVDGKRAYELARKDQEVVLSPRSVTIFRLNLTRTQSDELLCEVHCSTGTYIRSLARDIGTALGCCGHLTALVRTEVGPLLERNCPALEDLTAENLPSFLVPIPALLPHLKEIEISRETWQMLSHGRTCAGTPDLPLDFLASYRDEQGLVQAIFRCGYEPLEGLIRSKMICYSRE